MKKQWSELLMKLMYLAFVVGLVWWLLSTHFKVEGYKDDISTRDDSITSLNQLNGALQIELQVLDTLLLENEEEIEGYTNEIVVLKQKRIIDKKKYEEEIANIIAIPGDSLYKLVSGRLN